MIFSFPSGGMNTWLIFLWTLKAFKLIDNIFLISVILSHLLRQPKFLVPNWSLQKSTTLCSGLLSLLVNPPLKTHGCTNKNMFRDFCSAKQLMPLHLKICSFLDYVPFKISELSRDPKSDPFVGSSL